MTLQMFVKSYKSSFAINSASIFHNLTGALLLLTAIIFLLLNKNFVEGIGEETPRYRHNHRLQLRRIGIVNKHDLGSQPQQLDEYYLGNRNVMQQRRNVAQHDYDAEQQNPYVEQHEGNNQRRHRRYNPKHRGRHKHDRNADDLANGKGTHLEGKEGEPYDHQSDDDQPIDIRSIKTDCVERGDNEEEKKLLGDCYTNLRNVLMKYSKLLKEEEDDAKVRQFDVCWNLKNVFRKCSSLLSDNVIKGCISRDSSLQTKMESFSVVVNHFIEVCRSEIADISTNQAARDIHLCFEEEYRGTLSIRCDEYYEFNTFQMTKDECFFLRERFKCHESLLGSSCKHAASQFSYHFLLLVADKQIHKFNCPITRSDPNYDVFRYDSAGCQKGLIQRLEWCTSTFLDKKHVLIFHPENDLVAIGNSKHFVKLCKAYNGFTKCVGPIRESCPYGVSLFLQYESRLHQYILKMNFICSTEILGIYSSNLDCLRSTIDEHHLEKCEDHWTRLKPILESLKSVDFFCLSNKPKVAKMTNELAHLHTCHKRAITAHCGAEVGNLIVQFLGLVLSDPLYLRFGYKPNCTLHGLNSSEEGQYNLFPIKHHLHHHQFPPYDDDEEESDTYETSISDQYSDFVDVTPSQTTHHHHQQKQLAASLPPSSFSSSFSPLPSSLSPTNYTSIEQTINGETNPDQIDPTTVDETDTTKIEKSLIDTKLSTKELSRSSSKNDISAPEKDKDYGLVLAEDSEEVDSDQTEELITNQNSHLTTHSHPGNPVHLHHSKNSAWSYAKIPLFSFLYCFLLLFLS